MALFDTATITKNLASPTFRRQNGRDALPSLVTKWRKGTHFDFRYPTPINGGGTHCKRIFEVTVADKQVLVAATVVSTENSRIVQQIQTEERRINKLDKTEMARKDE